MMLQSEKDMTKLRIKAAYDELRPEPQFENDVKKHSGRFEQSRENLRKKIDYYYSPYHKSNKIQLKLEKASILTG